MQSTRSGEVNQGCAPALVERETSASGCWGACAFAHRVAKAGGWASIGRMTARGDEPQSPQHLSEVQDENGTDLSLLRESLRLSVEERFVRLEEQQRQLESLRGSAKRP